MVFMVVRAKFLALGIRRTRFFQQKAQFIEWECVGCRRISLLILISLALAVAFGAVVPEPVLAAPLIIPTLKPCFEDTIFSTRCQTRNWEIDFSEKSRWKSSAGYGILIMEGACRTWESCQ